MKAQDIVTQLAVLLPQLTEKFTTNFSATSLSRVGTTVTVATSAVHNLAVGQQVNIVGAKTPINVVSLTRSGTIGTMVSSSNHDFTQNVSKSIEISGANEPEFNGIFEILTVPDRKTVTFSMVDSGPTVATGTPLLLNGYSVLQSYNGLKNVTAVPTTTTFEYEIADTTLFTPAQGTIEARINPRISAAVSAERIIDAYTKQAQDDLWAFVVLGDSFASKDRQISSDATSNLQRGNEYRQQVIQPFSVYLFFPTVNEIGARNSRDEAEDQFKFLCQSLLGSKFDSGLFVGKQNPVQFVDHGFYAYNTAFYVHVYNFQQVADITFGDTVGYDDDVAFRDINMTFNTNVGTEQFTADFVLDEVLP